MRSVPIIILGVGLVASSCGIIRPFPKRGMKLGEEARPKGEARAIAELDEMLQESIRKRYATERPARRDAHTKAQGCVKARFTVNADVPEDLRVGLFASPTTYDAWIRFSNSFETPQPDDAPDGRGMAIKLMNVGGARNLPRYEGKGTYDISLINDPAFVVRDAVRYVKLTKRILAGKPVRYFVASGMGFRGSSGYREARNAQRLAKNEPLSLLTQRYFSMTPYAMGDGAAAMFGAQPCTPDDRPRPDDIAYDYYREDLIERLGKADYCFDFQIQLQADPVKTPIEDGTVVWDESNSEFRTVGRIEIMRQTFASPEQDEFCENLSIHPWNSMPQHRPLGGTNRVRKIVYETISDLRHEMNELERWEPLDWSMQPPGAAAQAAPDQEPAVEDSE